MNAPPHGPRSRGDGEDLVYRYGSREELYGLASGVQGRAWLALDARDLPDWQATADSDLRPRSRPAGSGGNIDAGVGRVRRRFPREPR